MAEIEMQEKHRLWTEFADAFEAFDAAVSRPLPLWESTTDARESQRMRHRAETQQRLWETRKAKWRRYSGE